MTILNGNDMRNPTQKCWYKITP